MLLPPFQVTTWNLPLIVACLLFGVPAINFGFQAAERAADQEQDRRQTCLPEGLSAASACCEALRAEQQGDDNPQRVVPGAKRPEQRQVSGAVGSGSDAGADAVRRRLQAIVRLRVSSRAPHGNCPSERGSISLT